MLILGSEYFLLVLREMTGALCSMQFVHAEKEVDVIKRPLGRSEERMGISIQPREVETKYKKDKERRYVLRLINETRKPLGRRSPRQAESAHTSHSAGPKGEHAHVRSSVDGEARSVRHCSSEFRDNGDRSLFHVQIAS